MAGLKIWDTESAQASRKQQRDFSDDVVGRFRSGYQVNNRPQALGAWRITTGDPDVADRVHELFGGDEPQNWDATGEDNIEVFTEAASVTVILDGPNAIRQRMVLRNRNGEVVRASDGEVIEYPEEMAGQPDPQAGQSLAELKDAARAGIGAKPETDIFFRLADDPDLGKFRFRSGSWDLASDVNYYGVFEELAKIDGPALATLTLNEKSFVAKSGPRKGKTVSYTAPSLRVKGAA